MPPSKNCCSCQRVLCLVAVLVVLCVIGGVLAWKFVPGASSTVNPPAGGGGTSSSTYEYYQCNSSNDDDDDCCNGVSSADGMMCDLRVDEILWAVPHNSAATRDDGMLLFPNHYHNLAKALTAGFRGINLDVCNCAGTLVLCHGLCSVGTVEIVPVFRTLVDFLSKNPTEMLLLTLELNSEVDQEVDVTAVEELLANSVSGFTDMLYVRESMNDEWPTLRAMKELNQVCK